MQKSFFADISSTVDSIYIKQRPKRSAVHSAKSTVSSNTFSSAIVFLCVIICLSHTVHTVLPFVHSIFERDRKCDSGVSFHEVRSTQSSREHSVCLCLEESCLSSQQSNLCQVLVVVILGLVNPCSSAFAALRSHRSDRVTRVNLFHGCRTMLSLH